MNAIPQDLRDPKRDQKPKDALSQKAYSAAYRAAEADVEAAPMLKAQVAALAGEIAGLRQAMERPVIVQTKAPAAPKPTVKTPDGMVQQTAALIAEAVRKSSQIDPETTIRRMLPGDENRLRRSRALIAAKAATAPASTTGVGSGAEVVRGEVMSFYRAVEPASVGAQLIGRSNSLLFGDALSLTVPMRAPDANGDLAPAWIEESASIPVKSGKITSAVFNRFKRGVITVMTNDLLRVAADFPTIVEDMIRTDTARALDGDMFDPSVASVSGVNPASLYFDTTTQASAGSTFAQIVTDLRWLRAQIVTHAMQRPVLTMSDNRRLGLELAMNADEAFPFYDELRTSGTVLGMPVLSSPFHPDAIVGVLDAAEVMIGINPLQIDTSASATLVMADDSGVAPTMAETGGVTVDGSLNVSDAAGTTPPAVVRSTYQTDAVAIRAIIPISYGLRSMDAAAHLSGVAW